MDEKNWQNVKEIFLDALEKTNGERDEFLSEIGDEEVRAEVKSLLDSHEEIEDFIEAPVFKASEVFAEKSSANLADKHFGHYKIVREIGAGGMGTVFLAERADGEFDQKVALKIVRQTIVDTETENRFRRERQILASLNHPHIAKLLDGGVSSAGEPFLVMEFVEGKSLIEFAEHKNLSIKARLKLFLKICSAVSFAHRNLIVHRDLKPSNILITVEGEPKLLDFGLAKILDLEADAAQTATAFRAFTPSYASPEQLRGANVSTASDVYSLGVVLYELLTGKRPFDYQGKSLEQIIKTVTETEAVKPSQIQNPKSKIQNLKGDIDNILSVALRNEPERRYKSVEAFADDIERQMKGLPVKARPATFRYRAGKFIRRNSISVAAAVLILLSLIGGIVATAWQARQTQKEKEKAEAVNAFLEQILKYSNPILNNLRKNGQETTVSEVLDEAARRLESGEFDSSPEVKAELERTVATTYYGQGKYQTGRKHLEQYVLLLKELYGEDHPKMIAGSITWAALLFSKGEIDEAEKTYRRYLPLLKNEYQKGNVKAETLAEALNNFAYLRRTQGDSREAESLFRETLELIPQLSDETRNIVATTRSTLASTIADQGRFDEALQTAREAVEEFKKRGEIDSPNYAFSLTVYGGFLSEKGEFAEADKVLREAEIIFRKFLSPSNLWLGDNLRNQAISLYNQGKYPEAIEKADMTLKMYEESFGKHYDHYPTALMIKGLSLAKSGQTNEGERLLREAFELRRNSLPKEHFWVAIAMSALGEGLTLQKKYAEAEPLLIESFESLKNSQGAENPRTVLAQNRLNELSQNRLR